MELLDVVLNALYELRLVLPDGASDMRSHEQRVEARENPKHFVGVLGRPQLVPETGRDAGLGEEGRGKVNITSCNVTSMKLPTHT